MDPEVSEKLPLGVIYEPSTRPKRETKVSLLPVLYKTALRRSSKKKS